jgi:hypothetical protein
MSSTFSWKLDTEDAPAAADAIMRPDLPGKLAFIAASLIVLIACTGNSGTPTRSPAASLPPGANGLKCASQDHGLNLQQLGWGFCYPSDWKYIEREVGTTAPHGVDTTLDIVGAKDGLFGFMIIGSYDRGDSPSLQAWLADNEPDDTDTTPIHWGNATEAVAVNGQLKRYALSSHRVYLMNIREGAGNLDLDGAMSQRLQYWVFGI